MARKSSSGGPRQPLSQRRPKKSASTPRRVSKVGSGRVPAEGGRLEGGRGIPKTSPATRAAAKAPARSGKGKARAASHFQPPASPERATDLYTRLAAAYPDAHCELDHETPLQLLVATILSAQCTDKRVNLVTPELFRRFPTVEALAAASQEEMEEAVRTTGFFRSKAKNIIAMANALLERHGGEVPASMDDLVRLPGVGRKTANVILGNAFGMNEGVVVDTHVGRVAQRLGLTRESDPVKVEADLVRLVPREEWAMLSHVLIFHGRRVCEARRPRCELCVVRDVCPSSLAT